MLQFRAVEIDADHARARGRRDECEAPFAGPQVEDDPAAEVLMPELVEEHRSQGVRIPGRLPPRKRAAHADDLRHGTPGCASSARVKRPSVQRSKATRL